MINPFDLQTALEATITSILIVITALFIAALAMESHCGQPLRACLGWW